MRSWPVHRPRERCRVLLDRGAELLRRGGFFQRTGGLLGASTRVRKAGNSPALKHQGRWVAKSSHSSRAKTLALQHFGVHQAVMSGLQAGEIIKPLYSTRQFYQGIVLIRNVRN